MPPKKAGLRRVDMPAAPKGNVKPKAPKAKAKAKAKAAPKARGKSAPPMKSKPPPTMKVAPPPPKTPAPAKVAASTTKPPNPPIAAFIFLFLLVHVHPAFHSQKAQLPLLHVLPRNPTPLNRKGFDGLWVRNQNVPTPSNYGFLLLNFYSLLGTSIVGRRLPEVVLHYSAHDIEGQIRTRMPEVRMVVDSRPADVPGWGRQMQIIQKIRQGTQCVARGFL